MWGRFQVELLRKPYPALVAKGDPRDTLMRFQILRKSFFDYDALDVLSVTDVDATVAIAYQMSAEAEEAATYQTLGFLEGLVEAAGGKSVQVRIGARAWEGAPRSRIEIHWRPT
jgi:hypothetical protein